MDLSALNEAQREAVVYFDSPLLVLAGAGSGKTRVITYKIAYAIDEIGFDPSRILAITFTNKAAGEMKERVASLIGKDAPVNIHTFHAFCAKILRKRGGLVGVDRNFTILDSEDRKALLKEVVSELNLDLSIYTPALLSQVVSSIKGGSKSKEEYEREQKNVALIFDTYEKKLKKLNALDFDDLLIYGEKLLKLDSYYRDFFDYVLIDEYQDTNKIQYEIVKSLSLEKGNVCAVGDEDQCIYTWRGANINNILNFEKDFKNVKVIKLEKHYRCSATILEAANEVIKNNRLRKGKRLYTDNERGQPIRLFCAPSAELEAVYVAEFIKKLLDADFKPEQIAVFYRANFQSLLLEEALRKRGIPYRIVGGLKFFERKEIKDVLAYLRSALLSNDALALKRILNVPKRGLGSAFEKKLNVLIEEGLSAREALKKLSNGESKQAKAAEQLLEIIWDIEEKIETLSPYELIAFIVSRTGYEEYLRKLFPDDFESRLENVRELGNTLEVFSRAENLSGRELYLEFLSQVALSSEQDELKNDGVLLMTVHAAKGLEFDAVFLTGLEEGLFPHAKSVAKKESLEEERRLFYVGMTRAKKFLSLSWSRRRMLFGRYRQNEMSRFLKEIPKTLLYEVRISRQKEPESKGERVPKVVFHPKFGRGFVKRVSGSGPNAKVTVVFDRFGEKVIIRKFLKAL